jgi:Protein of unknown function (DUF3443)
MSLAGLALLVSASVATAHGAKAPARPISVPVAIAGGQGTPTGARPMVKIRVGNSKPVRVLLDTGSTGLQLFAPVVPTGHRGGVTVTPRSDGITYSGGSRFRGSVALATVRIGRGTTAVRVPFGLVERASCLPTKPACDAARGVSHPMPDGAEGILGIGLSPNADGLFSPVLGLPGQLGRTWSLHLQGHSGALVLGARIAGRATATLQLRSRGISGGHPAWADSRVRLCDGVGDIQACVPGLFDSGTFTMQLRGKPLNTVPTLPGTRVVLPGTPVTVSRPGAAKPFWSYTAGVTKSKDTLTVQPGRQAPFVIYGVQAFYAFRIAYDEPNGRITLLATG